MQKITIIAPVAVALASIAFASPATPAEGSSPLGFYLGGGITQSRFDANKFTVDHKDNSWKAIAGVRLHEYGALEVNYVDFGKAVAPAIAGPVAGPFATRAKAYSAFGVGILPVGWVDLYAKAGVARTEARGSIAGVSFSDSATKFAYGAGVSMRLQQFAIRAEYEKYNIGSIRDLDLITLGATYTFGAM